MYATVRTLLILMLTIAISRIDAQAQETQEVKCPIYRHVCADNLDDNALFLAQLNQLREGDESGPGVRRDTGHCWKGPQFKYGKYIEQFRLLKLLELLDLQESQELEFIAAFHKMRRERRLLHEKRITLVAELADGLRGRTISDHEIDRYVREISELNKQERRVVVDFLVVARRILTPQQLGQLIVFQERFEFELLGAVRAFRERQHRLGKPPTMEEQGP